MKHISIIIAFIAMWLLPTTGKAQQYTGISGLIHVPSGEMHHEGDALIGAHFINKAMMPDTGFLYLGNKYNTFDYYVALTPFEWMEISYVCVERIRRMDSLGNIIQWSKDRYASVKFQPIKESKRCPAISLGCNDIGTSVFDVNKPDVQLYFLNWYAAATKHFNFSGNELGVTLGCRYYFRDYNSKWNGLVGGITFRPAFFPQSRLIAEYSGHEFLLGADVLLWQHLRLQASVKDFKYVNAGLCLQFNLLGKKYLY